MPGGTNPGVTDAAAAAAAAAACCGLVTIAVGPGAAGVAGVAGGKGGGKGGGGGGGKGGGAILGEGKRRLTGANGWCNGRHNWFNVSGTLSQKEVTSRERGKDCQRRGELSQPVSKKRSDLRNPRTDILYLRTGGRGANLVKNFLHGLEREAEELYTR